MKKVMKHKFNSKIKDEEIFFESDEEFDTYSYKTKSEKYIIITSSSTLSDE